MIKNSEPRMATYHTVQYEQQNRTGEWKRRVTDYCTPLELSHMKCNPAYKILRVEAARQAETIDVGF